MALERAVRALAVLLAAFAGACSSSPTRTTPVTPIAVEVLPRSASVRPSDTVQFSAVVTGVSSGVNWSADCGSVSPAGLFTAPGSDALCVVQAQSQADTRKVGQATVTVNAALSAGWSAVCTAEPIRATGTTYYFCDCQAGADADCVAGDDANAGTSPGAPRRTWAAAVARFNGMAAGGTVAFCRGGRWTGSGQTLANAACSPGAATSCILRDYVPPWASGDEDRPTFAFTGTNDGVRVEGANVAATDGFRLLNLAFVHSPLTTRDVAALYLGNYVSDFEACNCVFDGWYLGIYSEIPVGSCGAVKSAGGSYRRHFRGNRILNNSLDGALVDDNDSEYDGNYWYNNGHDAADAFTHITNPAGGASHTYYSASECNASGNRFINNEVYRNAFYQGAVSNEALWHAPSNAGMLIENNYIDMTPTTTSRWVQAIAMGSWRSDTGFDRPVVRRNRIVMGRGRAIELSSARQPLVEDNVIVVRGSNWSEDLIAVPRLYESTFASSSDGVVRNNTIHVENATGGLTAISAGVAAGSGYTLTGNSVTFVSSPGATCFAVGSDADVTFMDNNHCSGGATWMQASSAYSLAAWRAASGFDAASTTAPPMFVDPAAGDFTPQAGSPLENTGSIAATCTVQGTGSQACSSGIAVDGASWIPTAAAKPRGPSPDIGAFER